MCEVTELEENLKWASSEFFIKVLETYEKQKNYSGLILVDYKIKPGVEKGQNYISKIYRAHVKYRCLNNEIKNISFMIKESLEIPFVDELMSELNVFQRETVVYKSILGECNEIFKRNNYEMIKFGPDVFFMNEHLLVMEDLAIKGYATLDRETGLDFEHTKLVLEKLAKFHAVTAVLNTEKPETLKYHKKGNLTEVETPYHAFYRNAMAATLRYAKTIPELKQYIPGLENFQKNVVEKVIAVFTRNENTFNCLNHGDVWLYNILFKKNEIDKTEMIFIDFQEGYFGSPAIDLNFLFYTSCTADVQDSKLNDLIQFYHFNLEKTLKMLNFSKKIPTLDEIKVEMNLKITHAITAAFCIVPILFIENVENADAVNFIAETEDCLAVQNEVYSSVVLKNYLKRLLPKFSEMNAL